MDMQYCWSFTCYLSGTLGSSSKCGQLKSSLQVLLWQMFFSTGSTGSTSFFPREIQLLVILIDRTIFLSPFPIGNVRKSRGVNPNFSDKIAISIFESEFQFPNPNFSNKIAVSIVESEFQFSNLNFNNKIAVSIIESEFQFSNPSFRPPNVLGRTPACLEYTLLHAIGTHPPTDITTPNPIHTSYSLIKHSTSLIIGRLLEAHNMIEIFV